MLAYFLLVNMLGIWQPHQTATKHTNTAQPLAKTLEKQHNIKVQHCQLTSVALHSNGVETNYQYIL
jgi:hypothetical protein